MPTKNPRINIVLEKPLYDSIKRLAKKDGVSLSLKARDLVKEALEIQEDIALASFANDRERSYRKSMPVQTVISILRAGGGSEWDSRVIDVFLDKVQEKVMF